MKIDDPRHGTDAGYQAHRKDGEEPCEACRAGRARYMSERRSNPDVMQRHLDLGHAADRARRRLAKMYPKDYRVLYNEETAGIYANTNGSGS